MGKGRGKKMNTERLTREKSMSGRNVMDIKEMWKRKRERKKKRSKRVGRRNNGCSRRIGSYNDHRRGSEKGKG